MAGVSAPWRSKCSIQVRIHVERPSRVPCAFKELRQQRTSDTWFGVVVREVSGINVMRASGVLRTRRWVAVDVFA